MKPLPQPSQRRTRHHRRLPQAVFWLYMVLLGILVVALLDLDPTWFQGRIGWATEVVAVDGPPDLWSSLALDSAGQVHISSGIMGEPPSSTSLLHASHNDRGWHTEKVYSGSQVTAVALALASSGRPHIVFSSWEDETLRYAHFDGTAWKIETVDSGRALPMHLSLALDPADRPHIAYVSGSPRRRLRYARYDGTAWRTEIVDSSGDMAHPSLAVDATGQPHIAYVSCGDDTLRFASPAGTGWRIEKVGRTDDFGRDTALMFDPAGRPHIAHSYDSLDGRVRVLKYAHYDGNAWQETTVDSTARAAELSLALDASGRPHIGYCSYRESTGRCDQLKYASFDGSRWHVQSVASEEVILLHLDVDASGQPRLYYYGDRALGYARLAETSVVAGRVAVAALGATVVVGTGVLLYLWAARQPKEVPTAVGEQPGLPTQVVEPTPTSPPRLLRRFLARQEDPPQLGKMLRFGLGFGGWWLVNSLIWLAAGPTYSDAGCLAPVVFLLNLGGLVGLTLKQRWIAFGFLAAMAANLVVAIVLRNSLWGFCGLPVFVLDTFSLF